MINYQMIFQERVSPILISSRFFLFLVLFRCSMDPILNMTRVFGGMGLGALLNFGLVMYGIVVIIKNTHVIPVFLLKSWFLVLFIGSVSILTSPIKAQSARSFISVITYFIIFALPFYMVKTKGDARFLLKLIIFSALVPFAWGWVEYVVFGGTHSLQGIRVFSSFSHPNIFAFYLVLIVTLALFFIKSQVFVFSMKLKKTLIFLIFSGVILLVLTKTRSAWVALLVMMAVYGLLCERKYLLIGFGCVCLALLVPSIHERIFDIFNGSNVDDAINQGYGKLNSFAWRVVVWSSSWEHILQKPFFGHGYDTFSYYFLSFFPLGETKGFDAHNMYVQLVFDMGFLGLLGLLILFGCIFKRLCKYCSYDKSGGCLLLGLFVSFLATGYSDNIMFYLSYNWYFWLVMGLFCMLANRPDILYQEADQADYFDSENYYESYLSY